MPTGDQVTWPGGDVRPSKGREDVVFSTQTVGDHIYVLPSELIREAEDHWLAVVRTPAAAHVSLRAHSTDTAGNTVEHTITRAYGLK